jgi:outer membrane biosynthesis protein TonB
MEEGNLAILVDAKTEYTKQLVNILKSNMYTSFKTIFSEAKLKCKNENKPNNVLQEFQSMLTQVPKWNQEQIIKEYELIIKTSGCDWIEELITAVFVSHTRILTSINLNKQKGKINLKIPKTTHFIHKCYIDIARLFWKNSYLFDDRGNNFELQKNRREAENTIDVSINETIRRELPVKHILKEYLGNDYNEEMENTDLNVDDSKLNLRKMVMREIENCSKEKLDKFKLILENESNLQSKEKIINEQSNLYSNEPKDTNELSQPIILPNSEDSLKINSSKEVLQELLPKNDNLDTTLLNVKLNNEPPKEEVVEEPPKEEVVDEPPKEEVVEEPPKEEVVEEPPKEEVVQEPPKEENLDEALTQEKILEQNIKVLDDLDLGIEELNLDNMDDLTQVEEIYLENDMTKKPEHDVKKITLENKGSKSSNYNFFD